MWATSIMDKLQTSNSLPRPLEGITVLDMTVALAGPFATLLLAGLGARVIKIESPTAGDSCRSNAPYLGRNGATLTRQNDDDISVSALNRLRNKLAITLNLKSPEARDSFRGPAEKSGRGGRKFQPRSPGAIGSGLRFRARDQSADRLLLDHRFRQRRRSRARAKRWTPSFRL